MKKKLLIGAISISVIIIVFAFVFVFLNGTDNKISPYFTSDKVRVSFTGKIALEKDYDTTVYPPNDMYLYNVEWLVENNSDEDLLYFRPKEKDAVNKFTPVYKDWSTEFFFKKKSSEKINVLYMIDKSVKEKDIPDLLKKDNSEYTFIIDGMDEAITGTVVWQDR